MRLGIISLIAIVVQVGASFQLFRTEQDVSSAELAVFTLTPAIFNWELSPDFPKQIEYFPRKSGLPDLPPWLHYTYDERTSIGHLYGVPANDSMPISIDIIAVNRNFSFDVRQLTIIFNVISQPALEFVVEFKIDNMEPRDFCNTKEILRLSKTFSNYLDWNRKDGSPVTPVYLAAPSEVGDIDFSRSFAAQGVIIHLASDMNFSPEMTKLQNEVQPLAKLRPCPRNLKRTSVEKYFRSQRMIVDWCSFKLKTKSEEERSRKIDYKDHIQPGFGNSMRRIPPLRSEIPDRSYTSSVLVATIIPATFGSLIAVILIGIFWNDEDENLPVNGDILFFETAFRILFILFSCRKQVHGDPAEEPRSTIRGAGGINSYQPYSDVAVGEDDDNFFLITGDDGRHEPVEERRIQSRGEVLPQYRSAVAIHPNGSPALTYAV